MCCADSSFSAHLMRSLVAAGIEDCAGAKAGKEGVLCKSSGMYCSVFLHLNSPIRAEICDDDDDCDFECLKDLDPPVCSNDQALQVKH